MTRGRVVPRPLHWIVASAAALGVGALGGAFTDIGPWYFSLEKPRWQPPDWAFGPAWTFIYACVVIAAVRGWRAMESATARRRFVGLYAVNAVLNVLWSALFFHFRRPDWALIEVTLLWASILALILHAWPRSRVAAAFLLPYIAWVSFAAVLNFTIVGLNRPLPAG
jgi:tryptophan-rich sensory protein